MILQLPFHQNSCFFLPIQQEFNTLKNIMPPFTIIKVSMQDSNSPDFYYFKIYIRFKLTQRKRFFRNNKDTLDSVKEIIKVVSTQNCIK